MLSKQVQLICHERASGRLGTSEKKRELPSSIPVVGIKGRQAQANQHRKVFGLDSSAFWVLTLCIDELAWRLLTPQSSSLSSLLFNLCLENIDRDFPIL
jgi:hypothetical protein